MKPIELKISVAKLLLFFIFFSGFAFLALWYFFGALQLVSILFISLGISLFVSAVVFGIVYVNQSKVVLSDREIKKTGWPSFSIPYQDITKIQVGSGGLSIYKENLRVDITNMYTEFESALEVIKKEIDQSRGITIFGSEHYIKKYLG